MKKWNLVILILTCLFIFPASSLAATDSICAQVKIEIRQEMTLERQAFDAHMRINNGLSHITLENVDVDVNFSDELGNAVVASSNPNDTSALFFIRLNSMTNIDNVDGTGAVQPSSSADIHWLIIPAPGSSNGLAQGKLYYVGATLRYTIGGEEHVIEVSPVYIFVKPLPQLTLDYFLPSEVYGDDAFTTEIEPPVPYSLGVRVANNGDGVARDVKIDSAQPRIVDNQQGLLIGFLIEGSEVNGQPATSSLKVHFGDIMPDSAGVARWILSSALSGKFVDFKADFSHSDELGGELTSLLDAVNTHFLVHDVLVDLPGRDTIRDFLARDGGVYRVYESENVDTSVLDQSPDSSLQSTGEAGADASYSLSTPVTAGFLYVQLPDPYTGRKVIKEVLRSDGKRIKPENIWLSKTRNPDQSWQHFINLFDVNSTGSYKIILGDAAPGAHPPVLQFIPDRSRVEGEQLSFIVEASDPDGAIPVLSASPLPSGARFTDQGNGVGIFDWTPAVGQAGLYDITFTASDGVLNSSRQAALTIYPIGDIDGDGYSNNVETAAGSDPSNPDSRPLSSTLILRKGFNLVSFPAEMKYFQDVGQWMSALGGNSVISRIKVFDPASGTFSEAGYDDAGQPYSQNLVIQSGKDQRGLIIDAKVDASLTFTSTYCSAWDLSAGVNLIGTACPSPGLTAFKLLKTIGSGTVVTSIQRFNPETGEFETAAYDQNGQPAGVDFSITAGEGYFIYMKQGARVTP